MSEITGFRFRPSWVTAGQLPESYDIGSLSRASDMYNALEWDVLGDFDEFELHTEVIDDFLGKRGGYGGSTFKWQIVCTSGMIDQIRRAWFGKTDDSEGREWTYCTVRTLDTTYGSNWRFLQGIVNFPDKKGRQRQGDLWMLTFEFIECTKAPFGPDMTISVAADNTPSTTVPTVLTVTVDNDGDTATSDTITVLYALPAKLNFVDALTGANWTLNYSVDGTTWLGSIPVTPGTVRYVRAQRAASLAASASAATFSVTVQANSTGAASSLWTVSYPDEYDVSNNTDTDNYLIVA